MPTVLLRTYNEIHETMEKMALPKKADSEIWRISHNFSNAPQMLKQEHFFSAV